MKESTIEQEIERIVNYYSKNPDKNALKAAIKTLIKKVNHGR